MKHMVLSFKMKGDVISDHFLMLWFQKDSLDTIGLRTYGGGAKLQSPKPKSDIQSPKCASLSKGGRTTSTQKNRII